MKQIAITRVNASDADNAHDTNELTITNACECNANWGYFWGVVIVVAFILVFVLFINVLEKTGCETKKSRGIAGYEDRIC